MPASAPTIGPARVQIFGGFELPNGYLVPKAKLSFLGTNARLHRWVDAQYADDGQLIAAGHFEDVDRLTEAVIKEDPDGRKLTVTGVSEQITTFDPYNAKTRVRWDVEVTGCEECG